MKTKNLILINFLFCILSINLFAGDFSSFENEQIQEVLEFRFNTRRFNTNEQALSEIKKYHLQKLDSAIQSKLGDEAKLAIDNMLVIAEYTYISDSDPKSAELKPLLNPQFEKVMAWNENHPLEKANPYYLFSAIDVINCYLQFLPQSQMMKLGLESKKNNDLLRNNYPDFAIGYTSSGLWYYVAPAIGGGSKTVAKECFYNAVQKSTCNYEKFYANIYYSQICFVDKNTAECNKYLEIAENLIPGNRYTAMVRRLNAAGFSLFDYNNNREKVEGKF